MAQKKLRHIYWFAYYSIDSPSVRYRAKYPLEYAKDNLGISSKLIIPGYSLGRLWRFITAYFEALFLPRKNSIIVIQRVRSRFIYAHLLKFLVRIRPQISMYDLDDADYLEHNPRTIHYFAKHCRFLSAGSSKIELHFRQFNPLVSHITSPIPKSHFKKSIRNDVFQIGWVGVYSWGHRESLFKHFFPALKEMKFDFVLRLIGVTDESHKIELYDYFDGNQYITLDILEDIDWNNEYSLQSKISQFDIGVATLMNDSNYLSKSGIKIKQYLNNGVPVVCNNLPENNKIIRNGFNGFVYDSTAELNRYITNFKMMSDHEYYAFSENSFQSAKTYNHEIYFAQIADLIGWKTKTTPTGVVQCSKIKVLGSGKRASTRLR